MKQSLLFLCFSMFFVSTFAQGNHAVADTSSTLVVAENQEAELAFNKGVEAFGQKNYQAAIDAFGQAIGYRQNFAKAYYTRALAFQAMRNYDQAIGDFEKTLSLEPGTDPKVFNLMGNCFFIQKKYENAAKNFAKADEKGFKDAQNLYYWGISHYQLNNDQEALRALTKAVELKPDFADALNDRAAVYRRLNMLSNAVADYQQAVAANPKMHIAYVNMGAALQKLGKLTEAAQAYTKAIEIQPDYYLAYNSRGILWSEQKAYDKARADFEKVIALAPKYANAYYNLGNVYQLQRLYNESIMQYNKAITADASMGMAYYTRGSAYESLGEFSKAIADWKKALSLGVSIAKQHIEYYQ